MRRRYGNAQSSGAFGHGWITNRRDKESFALKRGRQVERRLLIAYDPRENRAVGVEQAALDLASALQSEGFLVPAIRYPTVAKGSARLRITVTAAHQDDQIRALCEAIKRLSAKL